MSSVHSWLHVCSQTVLIHIPGLLTHVSCSMELRAPLNPSCLHTTWAFFSLQGVVRESAQTVPHSPLWHTSTRPALDSVMDLVWTSCTSPSWLVEQMDWAAVVTDINIYTKVYWDQMLVQLKFLPIQLLHGPLQTICMYTCKLVNVNLVGTCAFECITYCMVSMTQPHTRLVWVQELP